MKTLLALSLASVCGAVAAQTPATNPMPDGSRDMYAGVGVIAAPAYAGAGGRQVRALPLLQVEWSNGGFLSGLAAGMHLSDTPSLEYGPLLAIHPGRSRQGAGGVTDAGGRSSVFEGIGAGHTTIPVGAGMAGMNEVLARLQGGVFVNYYLTPSLRLTNSVLYGAGQERRGLAWSLGLQRTAIEITPQHRLTLAAGVTLVDRAHNARFFGVTQAESDSSGFTVYAPRGGVRDTSVSLGWNWALSPDWMLASSVRATRLRGDAGRSPIVERATGVSVSSGLAYRF